jgi:hypothetical protein
MSVHEEIRRLTAPDIRGRKNGEPIVCLTSYHAHTARILDGYCGLPSWLGLDRTLQCYGSLSTHL